MVGLYTFLHCINLDYPNLTCQLRPWLGFIRLCLSVCYVLLCRLSLWTLLTETNE